MLICIILTIKQSYWVRNYLVCNLKRNMPFFEEPGNGTVRSFSCFIHGWANDKSQASFSHFTRFISIQKTTLLTLWGEGNVPQAHQAVWGIPMWNQTLLEWWEWITMSSRLSLETPGRPQGSTVGNPDDTRQPSVRSIQRKKKSCNKKCDGGGFARFTYRISPFQITHFKYI